MTRRNRLTLLAVLLFALACNEHGMIPLDEAIEAESLDRFEQLETNKIDILWVVDDSPSMCEEQAALTDNFRTFITGLTEINADFHLGVITTDMAVDNGRLQSAPGDPGSCQFALQLECPPSTGPVLDSAAYQLNPADPTAGLDVDALFEDFRCIATVGTDGTGFEKGLDAVARALSSDLRDTVNAGFRREEAWLAIIFVTDENDCSDEGRLDFPTGDACEWWRDQLTPVSFFADFLDSLPGTDGGVRLLVAGIIGPDTLPPCDGADDCPAGYVCTDNACRVVEPEQPAASCTGLYGRAFAGYRYAELIDHFADDDRGVEADICNDDFTVALDNISRVIRENLAVRCLQRTPRFCEDDFDCQGGVECRDVGRSGGVSICDDWQLAVEVQDPETEEWLPLQPSGSPLQACPAEGSGAQYCVSYDAASCPDGIGIEFTTGNEPAAGDVFRIRYPVVVRLPEALPEDEGSAADQ